MGIVVFQPIPLDELLLVEVNEAVHFDGKLEAMNALTIMAHRQGLRLREFLLSVTH